MIALLHAPPIKGKDKDPLRILGHGNPLLDLPADKIAYQTNRIGSRRPYAEHRSSHFVLMCAHFLPSHALLPPSIIGSGIIITGILRENARSMGMMEKIVCRSSENRVERQEIRT